MVMDPGLEEAIRRRLPHEDIEAVALLRSGAALPDAMRIVASFGSVVTCRIPAARVPAVRAHPAIISLKAARAVEPVTLQPLRNVTHDPCLEDRWRVDRGASGRGVLLCCLDWGCDFAHPAFRRDDGTTRLVAFWDQRDRASGISGNRYGYGRIFSGRELDHALSTEDPYGALDYHPAESDPLGIGAHGTHVLSIAAGSGSAPDGCRGLAPDADLAFVHLASPNARATHDLGDSVRILEALDFVRRIAGNRAWVANLSLGRTSGDHSGRSLVEQGMDRLVDEAPGRAIVQSAGNYFDKGTAAHGRVRPGGAAQLDWVIAEHDPSENELEIYYSGRDRLGVELRPPGGRLSFAVALGERVAIDLDEREIGRIYHRRHEPTTGDHHVDIILEPSAPAGIWQVRLIGFDVVDGRYHAWIERDAAVARAQSRFARSASSSKSTIGTIANGYRTITVGAYDPDNHDFAPFTSSGPTRDGRTKPDLLAPGVAIVGARSSAASSAAGAGASTRMSGTSMAAPHVSGTVALLFSAARRKLTPPETRSLVVGTADWTPRLDPDRAGHGFLNTDAALQALATFQAREEIRHAQRDLGTD
jgi:subtilisin family serine protease